LLICHTMFNHLLKEGIIFDQSTSFIIVISGQNVINDDEELMSRNYSNS
jgi:hypothetical protein